MYVKPAVQRFGSLRELTLIGTGTDGDASLLGFDLSVGSRS
jgi:hypothetical protein